MAFIKKMCCFLWLIKMVVSSNLFAFECASTDTELNLSIPCVKVHETFYSANLSRFHYNHFPDDYFWTLQNYQISNENSLCGNTSDNLDLSLRCVEVSGVFYQADLNLFVPQQALPGLFWKLSNALRLEEIPQLCSTLSFTRSESVQITENAIFPGITHDGLQLVISYAKNNDLYIQPIGVDFSPTAQATRITHRGDITDHKHVFYDDAHYFVYSTTGDSDLYLFKLDTQFMQQEDIITVTSSSSTTRTNDMLLSVDNNTIVIGQYRPSDRNNGEQSGHLIKQYSTSLEYLDHDVVINQHAHTNTASILPISEEYYLLAPSTPILNNLIHTQRDLTLQRFDSEWNAVDSSQFTLVDSSTLQHANEGDGIWMSTGLAYDPFSNCLFTGHTFTDGSSNSDNGRLHFRVFDNNDLTETYSDIMVDSSHANRAHFLLKEDTLFVVYDSISSGSPSIFGITYTIGR